MRIRSSTAAEIRLASRPTDRPSREHFALTRIDLRDPKPGEAVVRNRYLSVEPYMRGRMSAGKSYVRPYEVGHAMTGAAVGVVTESRADGLQPGDVVVHDLGWREVAIDQARAFRKVEARDIPPSAYLGGLGGPGLAAYVGVLDIGELRPGDSVFVSGAAGAVGSMAGQIARLKGARRVIGSAGTAEKVAYLRDELGFDAAFNYNDGPIDEQLAAAAPDGVDLYFDNVGGDHLAAAIANMNDYGRIALCGAIAQYNAEQPPPGPRNLYQLVVKRITARGFISPDHLDRQAAFLAEAEQWVRDGKIVLRETVVDGIENMPDAFLGLFRGDSVGKLLVRIEPRDDGAWRETS
jgi:NADPH-dependent curcumin reductase CurA